MLLISLVFPVLMPTAPTFSADGTHPSAAGVIHFSAEIVRRIAALPTQ